MAQSRREVGGGLHAHGEEENDRYHHRQQDQTSHEKEDEPGGGTFFVTHRVLRLDNQVDAA